ncbi:hypothetical protein [Lunatimonas salinarum]|uniref:hypothetical protein n=1 Tax=Lunatimonas salinarum TaxID=1774590 RepID=UPI001AE0A4F7|nr:hypothetical protein [Lunatimonas salinarum]
MEITRKDIENAQKDAAEKAIRRNKALGLSYIEVQDSNLVQVDSTGEVSLLGKARFGIKKIGHKRFKLNEQKEI